MAAPYDIQSLPDGFTAVRIFDASLSRCREYYVVQGHGATSANLCIDSLTFQDDLDAFIDTALAAAP